MGKKRRTFTVDERLQAVRARQGGLSAYDVSKLYGVSVTRLSEWMRLYESQGLAGLDLKVGGPGNRDISAKIAAAEKAVAQATNENPNAGISKIQGEVYRKGFLDLARETVRKIMRRQGVEPKPRNLKRRNKPPVVKTFERANPNDLWQTDIMTFMLKQQYRIYMIGFMDDNSRFIVSWGLYRFQTANNVLEVFRAGLEKHGSPKEVLSDNGRQYHTWRGKSAFSKTLIKLGKERGLRYSWGYPAIPDHTQHHLVFKLLPAREQLGMDVTEAGALVPELSTAAIVVHHPEARYFST